MSINITRLFKDISLVEDHNIQHIGDSLYQVLNNNKATIEELVQARLAGDINQEEFDIELLREQLVVEAEMITLDIASKAEVQKVINTAVSSLTSSVQAAL